MKRQVTACSSLLISLGASGHPSRTLYALVKGWGSKPGNAVIDEETLEPRFVQ